MTEAPIPRDERQYKPSLENIAGNYFSHYKMQAGEKHGKSEEEIEVRIDRLIESVVEGHISFKATPNPLMPRTVVTKTPSDLPQTLKSGAYPKLAIISRMISSNHEYLSSLSEEEKRHLFIQTVDMETTAINAVLNSSNERVRRRFNLIEEQKYLEQIREQVV